MKKEFDIEDIDYEITKKSHPIRKIFFTLILIIVLTVIYARYVGTSGLLVKEYSIKSSKITEGFNGFKITHFSDIHYGNVTFINELKKLVDDINKTKPDVIIFTGDFIDKNIKVSDAEIVQITEELNKLHSTYGNYYINGNHDNKFKKYDEMMTNSGFINLNNNFDVLYNKNNDSILLTGLSTKKDNKFLEEVFKEQYNYKINIMHYPDMFNDIKNYNYDLVLAGHSHNGQIVIPFYGAVVLPNNAKKYYKPYYKIGNTDFYISSGIGTSNYNFRLFNRPSYNVYRLIKK